MNTTKKILSVLLSALLCFGLLVFPAAAEDTLPESAHPYENDCDEIWEYTYPGEVNGFYMTFSEDSYLEPMSAIFMDENGETVTFTMDEMDEMYRILDEEPDSEEAARIDEYLSSLEYVDLKWGDSLMVYCEQGMIGEYDGDMLSGRTMYIPGNYVTLELYSDESVTEYGFKVESVSETAPEGVLTVSYYLEEDAPELVLCYKEGDEDYIYYNAGILSDNGACVGWSAERGGELLYGGGEEIVVTESLSLYPVYTELLLRPEEVYSFDNDYDPFSVNSVTVDYEGMELFFSNYYMQREDLFSLLKAYSKTLGITPLGLAAIREALLSPVSLWGGSCYGLSLTVALQHYGMLDLISTQEGAECVRDLEGTPELVSCINYYQTQEVPALMTQTTANFPGSAWYKMQLQNICETVAGGDIVLFGLFEGHTYDSAGHSVLLVGAYDDPQGNHNLIAYDSNFGSAFAGGYAYTIFTVSPDYSSITSDFYPVVGFDWLSDFSGFDSFKIDGTGDSMSWYRSVINHLKAFIEMLKAFFAAFSVR